MKSPRMLCFSLLFGAVLLVSAQSSTAADPSAEEQGLPVSLKKFYPPAAAKRVYTLEMLELGRVFGALTVDVERKSEHVLSTLGEFQAQYEKVRKLTPEWKSYFPNVAFGELALAIKKGEGIEQVQTAVKEIEQSCTNCHVMQMFKVQAIYYWPRFTDIKIEDDTGRLVPFHRTMVELSNQMAAIPTAIQRQDWEGAQAIRARLSRQFGFLEQSCEGCHAEPREYFVDKTIKGRILRLGGMIRAKDGDLAKYTELMEEVQTSSCIPCHVLHMPAAYMQMQFE